MAETTDWISKINEKYNQSLTAQKAQMKTQYDQQVAAYQKQLADAPATYQEAKNDAYVDNAQAERIRKESMANMGLSSAGGTSQTLQQRNSNSLLDSLSDVSKQEQDYTDNVNLALADLETQYNANELSLTADIEAAKSSELMSQDQWQSSYDLQNQQLEQSKADSTFSRAYSLYSSDLITKQQFKDMTGIDL